MKCRKCEKELIEKNVLNRKNKILVFTIMMVIVILGISLLIFINNRNMTVKTPDSEDLIKDTYIKNQIGLFKSENIIEEKYNDKNDLIYYKYKQDNEIKENNFKYVYDEKGRTTQITYTDENSNESTLEIEYDGDDISKFSSNYEIMQSNYYVENQNVIRKYSVPHNTIGNKLAGNVEYSGAYLIYEKYIDGKKYKLIVELDANNKIQRKSIYEVDNVESSNTFSKFGILPSGYGTDSINIFKCPNLVGSYVGIANVIVPIVNPKNEIYSYTKKKDETEDNVKYIYDQNGKILFWGNQDEKFYSRYEKIDNKTYWKYDLADGGKYYQALSLKQQYCISKTKLFFDENNEIYKYEDYNTEYITKEEFANKENEYISYMIKNKIDSDNIINAFNNVINLADLNKYKTTDNKDTETKNIKSNAASSFDNSKSKGIKEEYKELIKESEEYSLVDIDNNGTKELILLTGSCNADAKLLFYTYKDEKAIKLGENGYGYSNLYKMNDGNYLKQVYGQGGYQIICNIYYDGNEFKIKEIESRQLSQAEELNKGYDVGDKEITMFESTDLKELNKINEN